MKVFSFHQKCSCFKLCNVLLIWFELQFRLAQPFMQWFLKGLWCVFIPRKKCCLIWIYNTLQCIRMHNIKKRIQIFHSAIVHLRSEKKTRKRWTRKGPYTQMTSHYSTKLLSPLPLLRHVKRAMSRHKPMNLFPFVKKFQLKQKSWKPTRVHSVYLQNFIIKRT